jgi:hypothetical protein
LPCRHKLLQADRANGTRSSICGRRARSAQVMPAGATIIL